MFDGFLTDAFGAVAQPKGRRRLIAGHSVCDGAKAIYLFNDAAAGGLVRNLVSDRWHLTPTAACRLDPTLEGLGGFTNGTNENYSVVVDQLDNLTSGTSLTVSLRLRPGNSGFASFAIHTGTAGNAGVLAAYQYGSAWRIDIPWVAFIGDASGNSNQFPQTWTVVRAGSTWKVYIDDAEVLSASSASAFNTSNAHKIIIGYWVSYGTNALFEHAVVSERAWSRQDHIEHWLNPWAHLEPDDDLPAARTPPAGATVAAGLATETDSAFGIGWSKSRTAGLAAESDAALAATARRIQALGLSAESDAALAAGHARALVPGLAGETDTAMAATARRTRAAGLAAETDSAPAAGHAKAATAGQAAESDTALPVSAGAGVPVGQAAETDTAHAATAARVRVVAIVSETDAALAATAARRRLVGQAAETDTAPAIVAHRARAIGLAAEIDAALAATFGRAFGAGLAGESDSALALSWRRAVTVATALETNTALALVIAATGTAIPRTGGAVTLGGGSVGLASARAASSAAIARALGTPAVPR